MDEGTKNSSFDHISAGTNPRVLADQTQFVSEWLETVITQPTTGKKASSIARQVEEEESSRTIKLEDLAKLVNEDEEDEVHTTTNTETEDTSVPKSLSPSSIPTELKDLPSKFNELIEEVKGLKKQVHELEIKLPVDLKWELPAEFLSLPVQVASVQAKLKTLDALPGLLLNVTKALNKFS
ncbi:hypothetical protein Tco_0506089 [Tanacetum coccineum]